MPDLTPNYKFKKPIFAEETADIRVINENFDIADEELKKANDTIKNLGNDKQNKTDSNLLTIAKTIVGAINELFNNKLDKGGYTGTAQNLLTEISKIASKTTLGRMIVGKGLTVDSSGRTSIVSKNDAIIVNDNDIQLNVYDGVDSSSTTRAGSARAIKQANDNANGRVSKNGDEMTGALKVPAVKGLQLDSNYTWAGEEYSTILSNESGYSLLWRNSLKEGKSAEFIGITNNSKIVFRKDAGTGDKQWKEYEILHYGNFSPVNDLINGGIKVPLSAEMGKKLDVDKQNKTDNGLQTDSKEIVGAINESLWSLELKEVSGTADNPIILNDIVKEGLYRLSGTIIGLPDMNGVFSKALELIVVGYYPDSKAYKKQILFYHSDNKMWIRTNNTWSNVDNWTEWAEILTSDNSKFKGSLGISSFNYIQDVRAKTRGNGYIDKTTGKLYMCKPADETVNSVDDTTVTSNFVLATILENTKRNTNITYGTCRAFHGGGVSSPGTGGDILNFSKKIKYASAIHKGGDPSVSIIIDAEKSNLDNGIIAFKSSTNAITVINYTIVFE